VKSTLQNIDLNAVDFNAFSECLKMDIGDSWAILCLKRRVGKVIVHQNL
jgi:hypothetical protein